MKSRNRPATDEMRPEYQFDYSTAVRGKYHRHLAKEGACVVVLDPDIAKAFRTSAAVNEALRSLLEVSESTRRLTEGRGRRTRPAPTSRSTPQRRPAQR